jgi:hypothetical protein
VTGVTDGKADAVSDYPEHDKMAEMRTELDAIASFLEDLDAGKLTYGDERLHLAVQPANSRAQVVGPAIPSLLAQWSGIDQSKIEAEKRQMLASIQGRG